MRRQAAPFTWILSLLLLFPTLSSSSDIVSSTLEIANDSNDDINIYWVDQSSSSAFPNLVLLSTLPQHNQQHFTSYRGHQFVFSYHHPETHGTTRVQFTKDVLDETLNFKSDSDGTLIYEKKQKNSGQVVSSQSRTRSGQGKPSYGVSTRTEALKDQVEKIPIMIQNDCPFAIDIFWIDTSGDPVLMDHVNQTKSTSFDSYENHRFMIRQSPQGIEVIFTKSPYEERLDVIWNEATKEVELFVTSPFDSIFESVSTALKQCHQRDHLDGTSDPSLLSACLSPHLSPEYFKLLKAQDDLIQYRDLLIDKLRNYTCDDDDLETTTPISSTMEMIMDHEYQVDSHLLRDEAQIFVLHEFISEEECQVLKKSAEPRLERAVVVGEGDVPVVSESRKAQQAAYKLKTADDPLWDLYNRILNFTNSHTNYNLRAEGQEHFTVIQYNKTDEYIPHCDGACAGEPHVSTGRVATAVLYCEVPELGGATTFTKADVFVRPKKGMATIFTYMTPDGIMDSGYTQHSGCPVRQGQKWIATTWLREGVTLEYHSDYFEPSGKRVGGGSVNYDEMYSGDNREAQEFEQSVY